MASGILVLAEHLKGELSDITFELLGVGRTLADTLQAPLHAVVLGEAVSALAERLGAADEVLVVEDPQLPLPAASTVAALLKELIERTQISLVLLGGTNVSMGVGAMLAARTQLPFVNFVKAARVEDGAVVATSQLFGGKIFSDVSPGGPRHLSIYPGTFPRTPGETTRPRAWRSGAARRGPASSESSSNRARMSI